MKVIYFSISNIPSESANSLHVMKMCNALSEVGIEVHLVARKGSDKIEDTYSFYNIEKSFELHYFPSNRLQYLIKSIALIKSVSPDFVYGRFLHACTLSALLSKKTFFEMHDLNVSNTFFSRLSFSLLQRNKSLTKIIAITKSLKNDILHRYPLLKEDNIMVLADGADVPLQEELKSKKLNKEGKFSVGYVGSMYKGKGIELIVSLANRMKNTIFHIVGGREEEILYWQNKCLHDNIFFHGFQKQKKLHDFFKKFDVCLLPNQKSVIIPGKKNTDIGKYTSPLKMFEYMAFKKPIIASNLDVIREILNSQNAILVDPNNIKEWEEAIDFLSNNREIGIEISSRAFKDLVNKYSWYRRSNIIKSLVDNIK